jgi:hypothetical protein
MLICEIYLYYNILAGNWVVYICSLFDCLGKYEGMPENYRLTMDYEYQGKKEQRKLKHIVFEIYIYFP